MTRQKAIDSCMKHWEFLARTGADNKLAYVPIQKHVRSCFFCVYKDIKTGGLAGDCDIWCPGWGYWASERGHCIDEPPTYKQSSLYCMWCNAKTTEERKLQASRIVWMIWLIKQDELRKGKKNVQRKREAKDSSGN